MNKSSALGVSSFQAEKNYAVFRLRAVRLLYKCLLFWVRTVEYVISSSQTCKQLIWQYPFLHERFKISSYKKAAREPLGKCVLDCTNSSFANKNIRFFSSNFGIFGQLFSPVGYFIDWLLFYQEENGIWEKQTGWVNQRKVWIRRWIQHCGVSSYLGIALNWFRLVTLFDWLKKGHGSFSAIQKPKHLAIRYLVVVVSVSRYA